MLISTLVAESLSFNTPMKLSSNSVRLIDLKMNDLSHYSLLDISSFDKFFNFGFTLIKNSLYGSFNSPLEIQRPMI